MTAAMMICEVFKSQRQTGAYLYLPKGAAWEELPAALTAAFGVPEKVMTVPLTAGRKLAHIEVERLSALLTSQGFYLYLPPPTENLLAQHRAQIDSMGNQEG